MKSLCIVLALLLLLSGCQLEPAAVETTLPTETEAPATTVPTTVPETLPPLELDIYALSAVCGFVYDLTEEHMLYTHGDQLASRTPASITKLLTILTALEYLEPDTVITVGEEITWIDPHSSVAKLRVGNRLTVEQLVQGMMMQSGNDAAFTLAVAAGQAIAGGEELTPAEYLQVFLDHMNRRAWEQGMVNTHFETPDGTTTEGHRTTPEDILLMARLALQEPLIRKYAACRETEVTFVSGETHQWRTSNNLMHPDTEDYCPAVRGLKTGYTQAAGCCILALFEQEGRELLICLLGCPTVQDRTRDVLLLYDAYG